MSNVSFFTSIDISRLWLFMQTNIFIDIIKKVEFKQKVI